ncbi:exonuclease, putative [Babesia caballi]|uniref:Exonuclease, putative n=1 Tax=Babesia caballi TaxID=5871 RepID=A0AAV4LRP4_BABCB|nr:exonuclease, putative [Babesia caballi]
MGVPTRRWPIYATKRMVEVIPHLCASGERHTLVANVVFHSVGSTNRPTEGVSRHFTQGFLQTLNYVYSDRSFLEPPLSAASALHARELVFAPLNRRLVREVSPAIRPQPLEALVAGVEEALRRFAMYNTRAKEGICVNGLFRAVGAHEFAKALRVLRLQHKLRDEVEAATLNDYFGETLSESSDMACLEAVDMVLLTLQQRGRTDLFTPFVPGSWRPADVLQHVFEAECKVALDYFFTSAPPDAVSQAHEMLRATDACTGTAPPRQAHDCSRLVERDSATPTTEGVGVALGTGDMSGGISSRTEANLAVDPTETHGSACSTGASPVVETLADLIHVLKVLKRYRRQHDTGLVAVHIERDAVALATMESTFVVDLYVTDPLYQSTLFNLFAWLWSNSRLAKVGHNLLPKVAVLATKFDCPFTAFANMVDLRNNRIKRKAGSGTEGEVTRIEAPGTATPTELTTRRRLEDTQGPFAGVQPAGAAL